MALLKCPFIKKLDSNFKDFNSVSDDYCKSFKKGVGCKYFKDKKCEVVE